MSSLQALNEQERDNLETCLATMQVMLQQERNAYIVPDYLRHLPEMTVYGQPVDIAARSAIAQWILTIMKFCEYRQETAMIAMSLLDRFVATPDGQSALLNRPEFQLAALTAVYSAVKIHEQQALAPKVLAQLSNGCHSSSDVEGMERRMLKALQWRVNPPTAMEFSRKFLDMVPERILDKFSRDLILELVEAQVVETAKEYDLALAGSSKIAFAALLNAMETIDSDKVMSGLEMLMGQMVDIRSSTFVKLQDRLYEAISNQPIPQSYGPQQLRRSSCASVSAEKVDSSYTKSPVTVQIQ